jgi:hypothetical protein
MKQSFYSIILILIIGVFQSCCSLISCEPEPIILQCQVIDKDNNDLLNPSSIVHFDTSKIQVFTVIENQKKRIKHTYLFDQKKINITSVDITTFTDKLNNILIQLDSMNIESLKYTIQENNSNCCTTNKIAKKTINNKEADNTDVFVIVK